MFLQCVCEYIYIYCSATIQWHDAVYDKKYLYIRILSNTGNNTTDIHRANEIMAHHS